MCVFVYMYVYVYVYVCVCMYERVCIQECMYAYCCLYLLIYIFFNIIYVNFYFALFIMLPITMYWFGKIKVSDSDSDSIKGNNQFFSKNIGYVPLTVLLSLQ